MHQCFSLPFAFLFYVLAQQGNLSLTNRYVITNLLIVFKLDLNYIFKIGCQVIIEYTTLPVVQ